jgi:hypothetical protein
LLVAGQVADGEYIRIDAIDGRSGLAEVHGADRSRVMPGESEPVLSVASSPESAVAAEQVSQDGSR